MLTFAINFVSGAIHKGCQHQGGGVEGAGQWGGSAKCRQQWTGGRRVGEMRMSAF